MVSPVLDCRTRIFKARESVQVKAVVTRLPIEAFDGRIFRGLGALDEVKRHIELLGLKGEGSAGGTRIVVTHIRATQTSRVGEPIKFTPRPILRDRARRAHRPVGTTFAEAAAPKLINCPAPLGGRHHLPWTSSLSAELARSGSVGRRLSRVFSCSISSRRPTWQITTPLNVDFQR